MYGIQKPFYGMNPAFFRPNSNTQAYYLYKQIPVYLGGIPGSERIAIFRKKSGTGSILQIQKYDAQTGKWGVEYQKEASDIPYFNTMDGYLEAARQNVVVAYYSVGSGGFLSYTVIGKKDGRVVELFNRKDIFQGDVWLDRGRLFEQYGNRYRVLVKNSGHFRLAPYKIPALPGATVIKYSIAPTGKVLIKRKHYIVPVGSVVQIIRTDLHAVSERLLYSYTPVVKYLRHWSGFKFLERGMLEATIIPGGYDWDKAVTLVIESR